MQRVADLTIEEFRALIRETVRETMLEKDPDAGLELSDEVIEILSKPASKEGRITIEELAAEVGFKWSV
jgi:hypothetical protein